MIEIALALAVIGFALVAIIGVLPAGMNVQKDNRETTLVNFDANYLMSAIANGSIGSDELTNYVIQITMTNVFFNVNPTTGALTPGAAQWVSYRTTNTLGSKPPGIGPVLTNGANIVALLTTPKYIPAVGGFYSNYVFADFRAISGAMSDLATSSNAQEFAFAYRIYPEIIPYGTATMPWTNGPDATPMAINMQANYTQIRLRFRWPLLPNGQVGNSRLTFRTSASGALISYNPLIAGNPIPYTLIQPGTYVGVQ